MNKKEAVVRGPLFRRKLNVFGQKVWSAEHYCETDGIIFKYWKNEKNFKMKLPPKYQLNLKMCVVTEMPDADRPYSFKVIDQTRMTIIELAAATINSYDAWITLIRMNTINPKLVNKDTLEVTMDVMENESVTDGASVTKNQTNNRLDIRPLEADIILDYFIKYDKNKPVNVLNPVISTSRLPSLLESLDASLNVKGVIYYIKKNLNLSTKEAIQFREFLRWWLSFRSLSLQTTTVDVTFDDLYGSSDSNNNAPPPEYMFTDSPHYFGVVDSQIIKENTDINRILHTKVPTITQILVDAKELLRDTDGEWNDTYQQYLESAMQVDKLSTATNAAEVDELLLDSVGRTVKLTSYYGKFIKIVEKGAQLIVDEYALPPTMKTAEKVVLEDENQDEEDIEGSGEKQEELYTFNGVLFRLMGANSSETDRNITSERLYELAVVDDMKVKLAQKEFQGNKMLLNAILQVCHDSEEDISSSKPCTLLSTIVEYGGFRFQACCPLHDIEEEARLVHGFSTIDNDKFINKSSEISRLLPVLSSELNIRLQHHQQMDSTGLLQSNYSLSKNASFYKYDQDGRVYILNYDSLLPPDMPRSDTYDLVLKTLRPEFVRSYGQSLDNRAFLNVTEDHHMLKFLVSDEDNGAMSDDDDDDDDDVTIATMDTTDKLKKEQHFIDKLDDDLKNTLFAWKTLHATTLVDVAKNLDLLFFIPLDSYGLTHYIHSYGVNVRKLGLLYLLCKLPFLKQLILCEIIARSCKVLLGHTLRNISRKFAAESMVAVLRGRSSNADFTEVQEVTNNARKAAVVDIFNIVLGSGANSGSFWSGILADIVYQKFGLDIAKIHDNRSTLHMPMLFLAMKYHLGVVFRDHPNYKFNDPETTSPFAMSDVLEAFTSRAKVNILHPGHCTNLTALYGDALLGSELYSDAINIYKLELSLLHLANQKSGYKQNSAIDYMTYKLACAYYKGGELHKGNDLIATYLAKNPRYTPIAARLMALNVSINFSLGNYSNGIKYFDCAQQVSLFCFGTYHPIHCANFSILADCYYQLTSYKKAQYCLTLALDLSKRVVGENHINTAALETKIATIYIHDDRNFIEASRLLANSALIYDYILSKGVAVHKDASQCLYVLGIASKEIGDYDFAITCIVRSIELAAVGNRQIAPPSVVASLIFLGDLFFKKNDLNSSLGFYQDAWMAIKSNQKDYTDAGVALAKIMSKALEAQKTAFPLATRILVDTVTKEVETGGNSEVMFYEYKINDILKSLWVESKPGDYFVRTIKSFQEYEATFELTDDVNSSALNVGNELAVSIAIMNKLAQKSNKKSDTEFVETKKM
jgi:tetratricopeptide (TPR) repeat protein